MTREEAYRLLSDMIRKGFLTVGMNLAGTNFVLKTINEHEYDMVKWHAGISAATDYEKKLGMSFLVFSVFMINGENILPERNNKIDSLTNFFGQAPIALSIQILTELNGLKQDLLEASKYWEGFCYTSYSRDLWKAVKEHPNKREFTGIEGTDSMGLNSYQASWAILNRALDDEEIYNRNFGLAVLVASASNPKGSKSIRAKYDVNVQALEAKRKKLAREGSSEKVAWSPESWAAPVDTAEELIAELNRQMEGKKDKHDLFIENYIQQLEEAEAAAKKKIEDRMDEFRRKREADGITPLTVTGEHRALTPEETRQLMENQDKSNNLIILPPETGKEDRDRYFKKIGSRVLTGR